MLCATYLHERPCRVTKLRFRGFNLQFSSKIRSTKRKKDTKRFIPGYIEQIWAIIWTHMASTNFHKLYVKMILGQSQVSTVKMRFPDPYHEQHWHECPKHLHSHHVDPHGLQQTTQMKNRLIGNWSGIFLMCQMCALVQVM